MRIDITECVKGCADCQRHKVNTRPTKAPLQPIYPKSETSPFETVALDFIVKLPVSQGFDSILTITDQGCTKAAIFIPCNEDITAEETAALYIKHVFAHFGLPTKVISDRDPRFMSKFIQAVCKVTGVKHALSTAYHPRTRWTIRKVQSMAGNGHQIHHGPKTEELGPLPANSAIRA
jgi:hypothetical protein